MKIRNRFTVYNLIMLLTPIFLIGVVSVCFLIAFILKFPVEQLNIPRSALINPFMLTEAINEFFRNNPSAVWYIFIWFLICIALLVISTSVVTRRMAGSIDKPINELAKATDYIRNGNLNFEVMGSSYNEIDTLCNNFDIMRKELLRAREHEKHLREERSMLLANISHDLKTPVTSIKGYVEGIRDGIADTPEKLEHYLGTIYAKAEVIDEMVNNLSMFSRLELSHLAFKFEKTDINVFLRDFFKDLELDFERYNIEFINKISSDVFPVLLDLEKMRRTVSNLTDNAVKYGDKTHPLIEVKTETHEGGVYIYIRDNGAGIAESEIENVFSSFYRVDTSRSVKGSGLGLGIAKQIAEKHGGKLWLKSDGVGQGTTAVIYLPLAEEKNEKNTDN